MKLDSLIRYRSRQLLDLAIGGGAALLGCALLVATAIRLLSSVDLDTEAASGPSPQLPAQRRVLKRVSAPAQTPIAVPRSVARIHVVPRARTRIHDARPPMRIAARLPHEVRIARTSPVRSTLQGAAGARGVSHAPYRNGAAGRPTDNLHPRPARPKAVPRRLSATALVDASGDALVFEPRLEHVRNHGRSVAPSPEPTPEPPLSGWPLLPGGVSPGP